MLTPIASRANAASPSCRSEVVYRPTTSSPARAPTTARVNHPPAGSTFDPRGKTDVSSFMNVFHHTAGGGANRSAGPVRPAGRAKAILPLPPEQVPDPVRFSNRNDSSPESLVGWAGPSAAREAHAPPHNRVGLAGLR